MTGNIEFNEEGDRVESLYEVINIQQGQLKVVGTYRTNTVSLRINQNTDKFYEAIEKICMILLINVYYFF
jgi:hypothetical protein